MRKAEHVYTELAIAIAEADTIPPCQTTDPEIWFSDQEIVGGLYRQAKRFCEECPVKALCGEYAILAAEPFGIWGGMTYRERQKIRSGSRGRPKS
jgi:WhiB family redox-sensing transcriptional regulator